jgi:hypothetical protein
MPRDEGFYNPSQHFSPAIQYQLNQEQIKELIESTAIAAAQKVLQANGYGNPYEQPAVDPNAPRAYTREEVTEQILEGVVRNVRYWQKQPSCGTMEDRVEGVAFSILSMLDGSTMDIPAFNLSPDTEEDHINYCIEEGQNYYDPDTVVSTSLHELFHPTMKRLYPDTKQPEGYSELSPTEMREQFTGMLSRMVDVAGTSSADKLEACERLGRDVLLVLDGKYSPYMPGFMLFAAPTPDFNAREIKEGRKAWGNHIPLNRQEPTYGMTDSLVDAYDTIRGRSARAARDMFK